MSNDNVNRRSGIFAIALATIGVLAIVFVLLFVGIMAYTIHSFSGSMKSIMTTSSSHKSSNSKISYTMPTQTVQYIAGIRLSGEINDATSNEVIDKLETAMHDTAAIGVLFEVNSPGGMVVPSQEIYDKIKSVKAIKPVVAYVREMAASGAYYSSASATKIVANRGSLIGSIGVIMQGMDAEKLLQFLKITPNTIKTGLLKDAGSPTRSMTETDKKYLQGLIEATRKEFENDVQNGRGAPDQTMNFMSDGRVVLAPQALDLRLIDLIGTKEDALNEIDKSAKVTTKPKLFYYENIDSFSDMLSTKFSSNVSGIFENSVKNLIYSNETNELK